MTSFKSMLLGAASSVAESLGLPRMVPKKYAVDGKAGKRGQPYRRYIGYKKSGPFFWQNGTLPNGKPSLVRQYIHRFLHATKGWRVVKSERPSSNLHNMGRPRYYGPQRDGFVDRYGRWNYPTSAKAQGRVLVPCIKNAHKQPRLDAIRAPLAA